MAVSDELVKAIKNAVVDKGQPDAVATKIKAWLDSISESPLDADENFHHLETVYRAINTDSQGPCDEN